MIAIKRMSLLELSFRVILPIAIIIGCMIYLLNHQGSYVPGSQELKPVPEAIERDYDYMNATNEVVDLIDFIINEEGIIRVPKADINGVSIIGHGTSVSFARKCGWKGFIMSRKTARRILEVRLSQEAAELYAMVPGLRDAPVNVQTAVRSMYYNGGPKLVGPNCRKFIASKDWDSLAKEIALGHNPKGFMGLVKRRFNEASLVARLPMRTPKNMGEFNWIKQELYPVI